MTGAIELRAPGIKLPIAASLRNIAGGGCAVACRVDLSIHQTLRLELPIPGGSPLVLEGNVVRATPIASERVTLYGVRFRIETASLRDNVLTYIARYCQPKAQGAAAPSAVEAKFAVTLATSEVRPFHATVIAFGTEGLRVASDRVLRQEWTMRLELKLPGGMIGAPALVMTGRAKPGAKLMRGSYVQDVAFVEPTLRAIAEIERAMREVGRNSRQQAS